MLIGLAPRKRLAAEFRTAPLEVRTITRVVEATGHVEVVTRTEVPAPAAGSLLQSLVHAGANVSQGEPLAKLDARAASIALRSARAAMHSAQSREAEATAAWNNARDVRRRTDRLAARGYASAADVESRHGEETRARAALAGARAESEVARQNLAAAKLQDALHTIIAPSAGVVLTAPETLGAIAAPERGPLFVIGSPLDMLRIDAWVEESDIGEVRESQSADFTVPTYPSRSFHAEVEHIGVDAQRTGASVRYLVKLRAPNPEDVLRPGMTATLHIEVGHVDRALAAREAALRFVPQNAAPAPPRSRLWRLDTRGTIDPVPVTTGLSDGAYTQVIPKDSEALKPGDPVVVGRALNDQGSTRGPGISLGGR
jgi:HlyD family secretion protein